MLETPTAAFARAGARLLQAYPQAVDALVALLTDPAASPPVRLRAATAITRHAEAVYHEQQVVHRLDVLEEDVHGGRAPRATLEEACARICARIRMSLS